MATVTQRRSTMRRRRQRAAAATAAALVAAVGFAGWLAVLLAWDFGAPADEASSQWDWLTSSRRLLGLPPQLSPGGNNACSPRSIETFPPNLFSLGQRRHGAVLLHLAVALWLLAALAIVCDDYFVSGLEVLCEVMHLKPDVAGATFMAAGSSAPELFTSLIGVFFTKSDVGISTIVGSAVFNLLFNISLCGLLATQTIFLSCWPLFRDCSYYCLSIIALVLVIFNELVHWYEATALLILYAVYIVLMYFNDTIDTWISGRWPRLGTGGSQRMHDASAAAKSGGGRGAGPPQPPAGRKGAAAATTAGYSPLQTMTDRDDEHLHEPQTRSEKSSFSEKEHRDEATETQDQMTEVDLQLSPDEPEEAPGEKEYESPLTFPSIWYKRVFWIVNLPWILAFMITIPDCRRPGCWRNLFLVTILNSIVWIGIMSYMLVWMVCTIGDTLGIPDTVMGLTLLAAGNSVPDTLSSVFVVRDGFGDMAVSNSVGSNVFDILIGLGAPWFIGTAIRNPGSAVTINSSGLTYSSVVLLSTVVFLLVTVYANKMRLDKRLGAICMLLYLIFITISVLFETNVFAILNPPPCARRQN